MADRPMAHLVITLNFPVLNEANACSCRDSIVKVIKGVGLNDLTAKFEMTLTSTVEFDNLSL